MNDPAEILEKAYQKALRIVAEKYDLENDNLTSLLDLLINNIESDKSLIQVAVTSMLKKIISPEQDIRLHMAKFDGGYSARVLDTKITTPFFKKYFPRFANKETAFLTKATRAEIAWTLDEGLKLPFRSRFLVHPFLQLMDLLQREATDIDRYLTYIFVKIIQVSQKHQQVVDDINDSIDSKKVLTINTVISMLQKHFDSKLSSRLPVIAIHAIYQILMPSVKRYSDKILKPLNVHTSADKHGYGDIEICRKDKSPFEVIEVKHDVPIDRNLILDIVKK
jgi:DNA (cytosine-5)-methyltransferase 1